MKHQHCYSAIFNQFTRDTTVITPNRRLAATIQQLYQVEQQNLALTCWETLDILPITSFIQRLWLSQHASHDELDSPILLTPDQEQYLWEKILTTTQETYPLLQISATADTARAAWHLIQEWQLAIDHPLFESADDYRALKAWVTMLQQYYKDNHWCDISLLPMLLKKVIHQNKLDLPKHLLLIGFTELSPQLTDFIFSIKQRGTIVTEIILDAPAQRDDRQIQLPDFENEIRTMAQYAKQKINSDSKSTIGCVIPALDKYRDQVMHIFSSVFREELNHQQNLFNITAGKPLAQYPVIHAALQLLRLHRNTLSRETLSYLLTSPFLGESEKEHEKRCYLETLLREKNYLVINPRKIFDADPHSPETLSHHCPYLAKRIQTYLTDFDQLPERASHFYWAKVITSLLTQLGWPGERQLISDEYQTVERWLHLLQDFSSLDLVTAEASFAEAYHRLNKMANSTIFQAKTAHAPIQILGLLEAAGLPFDYVWMTSMDDLTWPPQPNPNPFIPKSLQREKQMPHATAERELRFCQQLLKQFKQCASQIIFSYPEKEEDIELSMSASIKDIPTTTLDELLITNTETPEERLLQAKSIEYLVDQQAPAIMNFDQIRGGVSILKQQALCPFKAFAEWRLHANSLKVPQPGLRATDRGTLIHQIIETIWKTLSDQETLLNYTEDQLDNLITETINHCITHHMLAHLLNTKHIHLEKIRLFKLLRDWLAIEKQRPPFKVLLQESLTTATIGALTLSLRIDRVDQLTDGKKLIIDYKTGRQLDINDWFGARPTEPQLPLYALLDQDHTVGVSFAQIASGELGYKGVSSDDIEIKGIKPLIAIKKSTALSWADQLSEWQNTLAQLSNEFHEGIATVDPKEGLQTCERCQLHALCRINEKEASYDYH